MSARRTILGGLRWLASCAKSAQDRRCHPTTDPGGPRGRPVGHPRHRTLVRIDDLLKTHPQWALWRPAGEIVPGCSDTEALTLAVRQAVLGHVSGARRLRFARKHLRHLFPYLPGQSGYNKRLRELTDTTVWLIRALAQDTTLWTDDVWVAGSTPVECGRSQEAVKHSDQAGWAEYGYCASPSRFFWGLWLHLLTTLDGLPTRFAMAEAKADERQVLLGILDDPVLTADRARQVIIGDKNYFGRDFEATLASACVCLLRPARKGEPAWPATQFFKPLRQIIESVNDTLKGQPGLDRHGGHTPAGVIVRALQRVLALTAATWHNDHTGRLSCAPWLPMITDSLESFG
jgi:hypothetical protein